MRDIRQIFQLAGQNFSGWKKNPRIVMTFLLAFVLCLFLSDEVLAYSQRYETSLQILEPFIWTYGDAASVMLSSLLLVLLFADMPFVNQETPYRLIRTKRSVWLAGQLVYVIAATIMYNLFLVIVQSVFAAAFAFPEMYGVRRQHCWDMAVRQKALFRCRLRLWNTYCLTNVLCRYFC